MPIRIVVAVASLACAAAARAQTSAPAPVAAGDGDVQIFKYWRLIGEPAIMIGMDVLGVLDQIIIDYHTRQLHLRIRDN